MTRHSGGFLERLGAFARNEVAVSAVEFALILPLTTFLLLGGFDTGRFILATQRTQAVANSIAEMIAQEPVSNLAAVAGDGVVSENDFLFDYNSAMFTFPDIMTEATQLGVNWWDLLSLNVASISFAATPTGCSTNCVYTPSVVWSFGQRACGTKFTASPNTATYGPSLLPAGAYGPGSLVVVDVIYTWLPTFGASYFGSATIERSVYMTPRNVPLVESNAHGFVAICP